MAGKSLEELFSSYPEPTAKKVASDALRVRREINARLTPDLSGATAHRLADIASATELQHELDSVIHQNAVALHDAGVTWEEIAKAAGITADAARLRWGTSEGVKALRTSYSKKSKDGLSTSQAAEKLGVSNFTVKKWIRDARVGVEETVITNHFRATEIPLGTMRTSWRIFDLKN